MNDFAKGLGKLDGFYGIMHSAAWHVWDSVVPLTCPHIILTTSTYLLCILNLIITESVVALLLGRWLEGLTGLNGYLELAGWMDSPRLDGDDVDRSR